MRPAGEEGATAVTAVSTVEGIEAASNQLRGTLGESRSSMNSNVSSTNERARGRSWLAWTVTLTRARVLDGRLPPPARDIDPMIEPAFSRG